MVGVAETKPSNAPQGTGGTTTAPILPQGTGGTTAAILPQGTGGTVPIINGSIPMDGGANPLPLPPPQNIPSPTYSVANCQAEHTGGGYACAAGTFEVPCVNNYATLTISSLVSVNQLEGITASNGFVAFDASGYGIVSTTAVDYTMQTYCGSPFIGAVPGPVTFTVPAI